MAVSYAVKSMAAGVHHHPFGRLFELHRPLLFSQQKRLFNDAGFTAGPKKNRHIPPSIGDRAVLKITKNLLAQAHAPAVFFHRNERITGLQNPATHKSADRKSVV